MRKEDIPKNALMVLAEVIERDVKRAFEDPEIQKEYQEWLKARKQTLQKNAS